MLKGIPGVISPDLIKVLMEMGHGDEIVLGDGNFPSASCAKRLIRCDGHGIPEILDSILSLFPLDSFVPKPVSLMKVVEGHSLKPVIWDQYREIVKRHTKRVLEFEFLERFEFYERAKKAYAVVASSEYALYANIILKKGIIEQKQ